MSQKSTCIGVSFYSALLKRDSNTDVLVWSLRNSQKLKTTNDCFWNMFFHRVFFLISYTSGSKRFRHRCFLVNSAKFLITPFLRNPLDGCLCINTFAFSKMMSLIFSGWVFSRLNLMTGNKSKFNISNPYPEVYFHPSQTSAMELFCKIVRPGSKHTSEKLKLEIFLFLLQILYTDHKFLRSVN